MEQSASTVITPRQIDIEFSQLVLPLPPLLILNPRERVTGEQVNLHDLEIKRKKEHLITKSKLLVESFGHIPPSDLSPSHTLRDPLNITWSPNTLCLTLDIEPIKAKLWVWNLCKRPIYIHCCGIWDETVRMGAIWRCFPRTRFWLPSGLKAEILIKAEPHGSSSVQSATATVQIAAQYMRDNVTCYFAVPMNVKFLNYALPPLSEVSTSYL